MSAIRGSDCPNCHVSAATAICRPNTGSLLDHLLMRAGHVACELCGYAGPQVRSFAARDGLIPGTHARLGAWLTREQTEQRARELLRARGLSGEQIDAIELVRQAR